MFLYGDIGHAEDEDPQGLAQAVRVSANGKLKRSQAGKKHLNSPKSGKRKRHLRSKVAETGIVAQKYIIAMGGIGFTLSCAPLRHSTYATPQGFHAPGRR